MTDRPPMSQDAFTSRVIILTLAFVIDAMVLTFLIGLFVDKVDNKALFAILGPSFGAIIGYFIGRGDRASPPPAGN